MAVLEIRQMGDPVLRERAAEVSAEELASAETQGLIDDMIETMRTANGAGLAAPQVGVAKRIAVIEVRPGNPRYPYKPPIPLTVIVNPELTAPVDADRARRPGTLRERRRALPRPRRRPPRGDAARPHRGHLPARGRPPRR